MRMLSNVLVIFSLFTSGMVAVAQNNDQFTFADDDRNENGILTRGQKNWDKVRCGNADTCVSLDNLSFFSIHLVCLV